MMPYPAAQTARILRSSVIAASLCLGAPVTAEAGNADVIGVETRQLAPGVYHFDVTIRSKDTGWDRYADRIEAVGPDGTVYGTRVLEHPHETEQPFTRDLSDVRVPGGATSVIVRARFKPTGYDGTTMTVRPGGK